VGRDPALALSQENFMPARIGSYLRHHHLAFLALFIALGGTSYAAAKIDTNDIAKNAITSKHVKKNSLKGSDIKESSLAGVGGSALTGRINEVEYGNGQEFFAGPSGNARGADNRAAVSQTSPNAPVQADALSVSVSRPVQAGDVVIVSLVVNGTVTDVNCGVTPDRSSCTSNDGQGVTIPPGSDIAMRAIAVSDRPNPGKVDARFGLRLTQP